MSFNKLNFSIANPVKRIDESMIVIALKACVQKAKIVCCSSYIYAYENLIEERMDSARLPPRYCREQYKVTKCASLASVWFISSESSTIPGSLLRDEEEYDAKYGNFAIWTLSFRVLSRAWMSNSMPLFDAEHHCKENNSLPLPSTNTFLFHCLRGNLIVPRNWPVLKRRRLPCLSALDDRLHHLQVMLLSLTSLRLEFVIFSTSVLVKNHLQRKRAPTLFNKFHPPMYIDCPSMIFN